MQDVAGSQDKTVSSTVFRSLKNKTTKLPDIVCFSHLRWNFVYQRPQHLLSRFARQQKVFFVEEPLYDNRHTDTLSIAQTKCGVTVITPKPHRQETAEFTNVQIADLLRNYFSHWPPFPRSTDKT